MSGREEFTEMEFFSELLQARRIALGLSIRDVADRLGCTKSTVQSWNVNRYAPRYTWLPRIAEALEIPLTRAISAYNQSNYNGGHAAKWAKTRCQRGHVLPEGGAQCPQCVPLQPSRATAARQARKEMKVQTGDLCSVSGCHNPRYALGLCEMHRMRGLRHDGDLSDRQAISNFRGVHKKSGAQGRYPKPWVAGINLHGRHYPCGVYAMEEDAARAYDRKAYELLGDKAQLNFPME